MSPEACVLWVGPGASSLDGIAGGVVAVDHPSNARQELRRAPFDAAAVSVGTDGEGLALLDELREHHPRLFRIALVPATNARLVMSAAVAAHHTLPTPCDAGTLRHTLDTATRLRQRFHQARIHKVVGASGRLPSPPKTYLALTAALRAPSGGLEAVSDVVSRDVALASRVLHVVNSPALSRGGSIRSIHRAVTALGVERIRSLVLALEIGRSFEAKKSLAETLQEHSVKVAELAGKIAGTSGASTAYTAGLLHDVGKLVLATQMPREYEAIERSSADGQPSHVFEESVWGFSHAEVGAYLLGLWGLPLLLVDCVAGHHHPPRAARHRIDLTTVVHVADALVHEAAGDENRLDPSVESDSSASNRLLQWRALSESSRGLS